MRVHVISSNEALTRALSDELTEGGEHTLVARAEAEVLLVDGDEANLETLLHDATGEALRRAVVFLADPDQLSSIPLAATDIALKPVRPGEIAARLKIAHARAYGLVNTRADLLAWAVASAGDIIEITTPEPKFEYINPAFTRILGFSPSEIIGRTPASVMRSDMHEPGYFQKIDATLSKGRAWKGLLISRTKDERLVYLESTIAPVLDPDGVCTHHVAVKRDITARLQSDNELRRKSAELEQARDAALEASRSKSQFLANMSHELRTPLNAIIGYSEMLTEDAAEAGNDAMTADLGRIKKSGEHLLELINDVLDLSKIEAGAMRMHLESFDVRTAISSVVATVQPLMRTRENELELDVPADIGIMRADLTKIRQTLLNLLSNGSKFTHNGTITLRVRALVHPKLADALQFEVIDTGIGIDPDAVKRLFRPFMQADASTTRKYGGTGLGLAISQRYCEMMGGRISVTSAPGAGSTFTVLLPRSVAEPAEDTPSGASPVRTRRQGHRILVVDDDPAMCDLLQRALGRQGFDVVTARDGREGLASVRAKPPEAVVLDVMMPNLDGWAMLTELKGDPATADIPVVMLTVLEKSDVGFALGAVDFLLKPVQTERLTAVLHRHCRSDSARVLVIDDDPLGRERMRRVLHSLGHVVIEAADGREGIAKLETDPPDLVLLDLVMPVVDGFGVLEHMRATDLLSWLPVVVVTAKDLSAEERAALSGTRAVLERGSYARDELLDVIAVRVARLLGN